MSENKGTLQDNEYGDMTPEQIEEFKRFMKEHAMTDEKRETQQRLMKEGKITVTHVNRILDMKRYDMSENKETLQDGEYGDMTPEQIKDYEKGTKKYEMTPEEMQKEQRLMKEGKITITHVNRMLADRQ